MARFCFSNLITTLLFYLTPGIFFMPCLAYGFNLSDLGSLGAPNLGKHQIKLSGERYNQDRSEYGTAFGLFTLYHNEISSLKFTTKYSHLNVTPNTTGITDLYDSEFGFTYSHKISETNQLSLYGGYGTKSDKPFKDSSVNTLNLNAIYSFAYGPKGRWTLLLNYSNNRPILNNIPLPFFAYTYIHSQDFIGTFGAPFASIYWKFAPKWSTSIFAVVPWIFKGQIFYHIVGPFRVYAGVDLSQQSYFQYGRSNNKERLFHEEHKAFVGLKAPLLKNLMLDAEFGYAFHRQFFIAESYSWKPKNPTDLEDSFYGQIGLNLFF